MAQVEAHQATERIVAMFAGTQSGKTGYGPWWLNKEIQARGTGDYLAVTASYDLFKLKMLPEMLRVFDDILGIGRYWAGDKVIELKDPKTNKFKAIKSTDPMYVRIILRSANALGGLESGTVKGLWLDEAGQDEFGIEAWRALRRRGAINRARILLTTTLYNLGWTKTQIIDRCDDGGVKTILHHPNGGECEITVNPRDHGIRVIHFDSIINPLFPMDEYEEARATMPSEEFIMFYRGRVAKLRHLIYDNFDAALDTVPRFEVPYDWDRFIGVDFGGVHTAAVYFAEDPDTKMLYGYREYLEGGKTEAEHKVEMMRGEYNTPRLVVGGAPSEDQWRQNFAAAGLDIRRPRFSDLEIGISRVYSMHKRRAVKYFNDLEGLIEQKGRYRRKKDRTTGEVTDEIEAKNTFHFLDAERYILSQISSRSLDRNFLQRYI